MGQHFLDKKYLQIKRRRKRRAKEAILKVIRANLVTIR